MVSHDLRNPLGAIFMCTSILLRTEERPGSRQEIERIQRSAERMNRLIGDLLNVASIEAGQLTVDTKSCPVDPMVEETVGAHQAKARAKGLRLEREVPGALVAVECDRERILEVFGNLLDNAIKFTPEGGSIKVGAEKRGEQMLFSVADNGSGIGADELSHVFDRFWQAKKTARLGTGLGLSIAKGLVEANGGKLWVESQIGVGSTFFFTLSTSPEVAEPRPATSK
jgi:signal transduction histidine kinase